VKQRLEGGIGEIDPAMTDGSQCDHAAVHQQGTQRAGVDPVVGCGRGSV
jgi:hypothetical protein